MNPFCAALFLICLAVGVVTGGHAFAKDEAPAIDKPGYWRVMGQDDEHSTSRCIGNPDTPLCAIETIIACFVRKNNELCKIGQGAYWVDLRISGLPQPVWAHRYRVVKVKRITRDHQRHSYLGRHPPPVLKGDLIVTIQDNDCYYGKCQKILPYPLDYRVFLVRFSEKQWHIVSWDGVVDRW
jgi:hypothetical protein